MLQIDRRVPIDKFQLIILTPTPPFRKVRPVGADALTIDRSDLVALFVFVFSFSAIETRPLCSNTSSLCFIVLHVLFVNCSRNCEYYVGQVERNL